MIFRQAIRKVIAKSDILLEVLDARFIDETRNPFIEKKIKEEGKKLIYVVNKIDLVQDTKLLKKIRKLKPLVQVSCKKRMNTGTLRDFIKRYANKEGFTRVGVIGYPNTGKSSLINVLAGRAKARTSSQSGMTRGVQFVRLTKDITLLDSPGTFVEEDKEKLVLIASIDFSKVKDPDYYVELIQDRFPGVLEDYYKVEDMDELAHKRGFLKKGGLIDEVRLARYILKDWQQGKIKI